MSFWNEKFKLFIESDTAKGLAIFVTVVIAGSVFEMFKDKKIDMLYMIIAISFLTILINTTLHSILYKSDRVKDQEESNKKLALLKNIMDKNGFNQIIDVNEVEKIEELADTIIVFTEDLETDYGEKEEVSNKGLLSEVVKDNLLNKKKNIKYKYLMKENPNNIKAIGEYRKYMIEKCGYENILQKVTFYLVLPEDYGFFSEVYIYKNNKPEQSDSAVEWMPSLGTLGDKDDQYFVRLDDNQVLFLNEVVVNLMAKYTPYNDEKVSNDS